MGKIVLVVDGNLLARKSFYKFTKLATPVTVEELLLLSSKLGKSTQTKLEAMKKKAIEEEDRIQEVVSEESGNTISVTTGGRIEKNIKKFSIANEKIKIPTGTLYGMLRSIVAATEKYDIGKVIICYDPIGLKKEPQMRNKKCNTYKNRKKDLSNEQKFFASLELAISFFYKIGVMQVTSTQYEADDIMQYFTHHLYRQEECYVLTNDHDMYQLLVKGRVSLLKINTKVPVYTSEDFREEHRGLLAKRYNAVLTLAGCSTDNVKGVSGIGEAGAITLIKKFKTVPRVFSEYKSSKIEQRLKTALAKEEEKKLKNVKLSHFLVSLYGLSPKLRKDLKITKYKKTPKNRINRAEIFLKILNFKSLLTKSSMMALERMINNQF